MNLVPLFEEALEFQDYNGTVLSDGKVAVYYIGRTRLADIYEDVDGSVPAENPRILNNLGMGPVYVNPAFDYEMVVFDTYGSELFSVKKYLASKGEHSTANVVVTPSESIAVSAWTVGDVQVYMPYLTGQLGKVYEGIEPIVVNNVEDKISAQHVPLGVQDPLYFVQDDEEACIIGFSGETLPEGTMNESAFGYEDGQITSYNGSAFSAGNSYEAGSYVDIDGNTINVTGLQPSGEYVTSGDLDEYTKRTDFNDAISSLNSSKLDVDVYSSQSALFLTALPSDVVYSADITGLATTAQLNEKLDKTDSANFYPMNSNPSGYINELPSDLATTGFVAGVSGDITALIPTGDYLTKESADTLYQPTGQYQSALEFGYVGSEISSINGSGIYSQGGGVTGDFTLVEGNGIQLTDDPIAQTTTISVSGDYATNTQLQNVSADITAMIPTALTGDYLDKASADTLYYPLNSNPNNYLTTAYTPEFAYHDTAISSIDNSALYDTSAQARINTLAGRISTLSSEKADTTALTAYQEITGMTAYQEAGDYYSASNPNGFITGVDLTPYQLTADMTAYQPVGDYLTTADSANFYTTANESGFISEVPAGTMNESAFEYDENDKISGYNGSAFAGGSDVPEGVMVESGLEYNAVNEISAYNGSAIAQYGAEKQWLVHDDTIVHVANSAQYAFGCNISALQRLMGIDETVLWEGTDPLDQSCLVNGTRETATLSEPLSSFNKIRIYAVWNPWIGNFTGCNTFEYPGTNNKGGYIMNDCTNQGFIAGGSWSANETTFRLVKHWQANYPAAKETSDGLGGIFKIVGIGRKQ